LSERSKVEEIEGWNTNKSGHGRRIDM